MRHEGFERRNFLKGFVAATIGAGIAGQAVAKPSPDGHPKPHDRLPDELLPYPQISANPDSEGYWHQVRKAFELPHNYIHMNTGTTGSQPTFAINNLMVYNLYKSRDPRDWEANLNAEFPELFPRVNNSASTARQAAIAAMYNANQDEIVLSYNTTDACNLVFSGTPWNPGDRIVTTIFEHPALNGPIAWARDYRGVEVAMVELPVNFTPAWTVQDVLALFEAELKKPLPAGAKQYVAISEIFYKNGLRMPVKEICQLARSYDAYTIIDTAHGWGMLPIDCHDYGADFICGGGHKWLCGGPGTGIFYCRNSSVPESERAPFAMGNFFLYGNPFVAPSSNYQRRTFIPSLYVQMRGEVNTPALYAMTDTAAFFNYIGTSRIYDRAVALGNHLKRRIESRWGPNALWVQENPDPAFATGLTCFNPFAAKDDPSQFATMNAAINTVLAALATGDPKIYIRSTTFRASKTGQADNLVGLRISTHAVYNDFHDVDIVFDRLVAAIDATGLPQA